jgi:hypothetical protein
MGQKKKVEEVVADEEEVNPLDVCSLEDYSMRYSHIYSQLYEDCDFRVARNSRSSLTHSLSHSHTCSLTHIHAYTHSDTHVHINIYVPYSHSHSFTHIH